MEETRVLTTIDEATPSWLTSALRHGGQLPVGAVQSIEMTRIHAEQLYSLGYFLNISYTADAPATAPAHAFLKLPRTDAPAHFITRHAVPEVRMYQAVARDQYALPVIPCYDAKYDGARPSYHLLLADLSTTHVQPPNYRLISDYYIEETVNSLAELHAYWWERVHDFSVLTDGEGITSSAVEVESLCNVFPRFLDHVHAHLDAADRRIYVRVFSALPRLRQRRQDRRWQTLVHGDAHFWNFLYPRDPHVGRTCILDWQSYHASRGTLDLAYVIVLRYPHRTPENELALVRQYHQQLLLHGVSDYVWHDCWNEYRHAVVEQVIFALDMWKRNAPESFWTMFIKPSLQAFRELAGEEITDAAT